jgi:outer membrane protein assembly factor BamB
MINPSVNLPTAIAATKKPIMTTIAWTYILPANTRIDSALIHNGVAYYNMSAESARVEPLGVQAYDLQKQAVHWTIPDATYNYLVLGGETLFFISPPNDASRKILAINIKNGQTNWSIPAPGIGYEYEMAYGDNKLFLGIGSTIYGLDVNSGELLWQRDLPSNLNINTAWFGNTIVLDNYSALSYYDGSVFIRLSNALLSNQGTIEGQYLVLDSQTGTEKWKNLFTLPKPAESLPFAVASRPTFDKQGMFFIDWTGQGNLLNTINGEGIWQTKTLYPASRPLFTDKRVCFVATNNDLVCLDAETGSEAWKMSFPKSQMTSPLRIINDIVLVVAENYVTQQVKLLQIDLNTGSFIGSVEIPNVDKCNGCVSSMEINGEELYITFRHSIIAIELELPR